MALGRPQVTNLAVPFYYTHFIERRRDFQGGRSLTDSAQRREAVQQLAGGVEGTLVGLGQRRIDDGAAIIADRFE